MAKSEILMWVAGILMMIILGLAVAPTITKSGDTSKIAIINSEIENIRKASNLWVGQNSTDFALTYYCNFNANVAKDFVNLEFDSANNRLTSKANNNIKYEIGCNSDFLRIIVSNLDSINGAFESINKSALGKANNIEASQAALGGYISMDYKD